MNRSALHVSSLAIALAGAWSCSHTQTATDQPKQSAEPERSPPKRETKPRADGPEDRGARDDAALPLATSPAALFEPGAVEALQRALIDRGYLSSGASSGGAPSGKLDGPTDKALRSFQEDSSLPATGVPDDLTVRKLGLDVSDIFKAAPAD